MKRFEPATHTVVIHRAGGRHDQFVSHSVEDAEYVAARFRAAGWDVDINPVEPSPIADTLREVA